MCYTLTLLSRMEDDLRVVDVCECLPESIVFEVDDDQDEREEWIRDGEDENARWIFFSCDLQSSIIYFLCQVLLQFWVLLFE